MEFLYNNKCCILVGNSSTESENKDTDFNSAYIPTTNVGGFDFEVE